MRPQAESTQSPRALNWLDFCLDDDFATQLGIFGQGTSPRLWGRSPEQLPESLQHPAAIALKPQVADQSEFLLPLEAEAEARYSDLWKTLRS